MWYVIKIFIGEMALYIYARLFGYYKHLDVLPAYNWFKILEGDYSYLYKRRIKKVPEVFKSFAAELFWQMEKVEMGYFDDMLKLAYLKSLWMTEKRPQFLNQARSLQHRIVQSGSKESKPARLNDMLNYIEETFSQEGQIDPKKISTSRFYSLYNRAVEKNEREIDRLNKK
jgi:hypothetical protein